MTGRPPNLLIIGAQKCGTTWLHSRLDEHPDIFMSEKKELSFFTRTDQRRRNFGLYSQNFEGAERRRYAGESTPAYFWTYDADSPYCQMDAEETNTRIPESIFATLGPDIRLLLSLRNPVHRAISAFLHHFKMGRIKPGESLRVAGKRSGIIDMGFYQRHLACWERVYEQRAMRVVFFDDIARDGAGVLRGILEWLGLPQVEIPGANTAEHTGFGLVAAGDRLTVDTGNAETREKMLRRGLSLDALPVIEQADLDFLHQLYRADIDYILRRFARADLGWDKPPVLADFAAGTG